MSQRVLEGDLVRRMSNFLENINSFSLSHKLFFTSCRCQTALLKRTFNPHLFPRIRVNIYPRLNVYKILLPNKFKFYKALCVIIAHNVGQNSNQSN